MINIVRAFYESVVLLYEGVFTCDSASRYSMEKKEKLGTRWVKCGKTSGPDCRYRVTDVIEGTEVQFQVRAENEAGVGHPSEPTEILTIEDPTGKSTDEKK